MNYSWLGPEAAWDICVKHGWRCIACLGMKNEKQRVVSHSPFQRHTLMSSKGSLDLASLTGPITFQWL